MDEDEALQHLARAIMALYKDKSLSADDFEAYAYRLRIKIAMSDELFAARFRRGYHVLIQGMQDQ